mgnify:CR=1 FL=1|jgi:hypothetical protein
MNKAPTIFEVDSIPFRLEGVASLNFDRFEKLCKENYKFSKGVTVAKVWKTLVNEIHKAKIPTKIPKPGKKK